MPSWQVAAGGVVAGEGRWLFPGFAAATGVLIVAIGEGLVSDDPETLEKKEGQHQSRDALREIEAKAAKDAKPVGHYDRGELISLNEAASQRASESASQRGNRVSPPPMQRLDGAPAASFSASSGGILSP